MKKLKRVLIGISFVLMFMMVLVGCARDVVNVRISFYTETDIVYKTIKSDEVNSIKIPKNPTKENYTFNGWFWDEGVWKKPFYR